MSTENVTVCVCVWRCVFACVWLCTWHVYGTWVKTRESTCTSDAHVYLGTLVHASKYARITCVCALYPPDAYLSRSQAL